MRKIYSDTVATTETNAQIEIAFELERGGTETVTVIDELLTTEEAARERAEAIFLEQAYTHKIIEIETPHIDGLHIGNIISYNGLLYAITEMIDTIQGAKAAIKLKCTRWL